MKYDREDAGNMAFFGASDCISSTKLMYCEIKLEKLDETVSMLNLLKYYRITTSPATMPHEIIL